MSDAGSGTGQGAGNGFYAMAGIQFMSAIVQADAVRKQAAIQADIDKFNAELAEYDAWRVQGAGMAQIARYQTQLDQAAGKAKTAAAAAGIDTKDGSMSEIVAENELTGFLNKLDMDNRVHEQAMGYKRQARNMRLQSDMRGIQARTQSNSIMLGGIAQAAGTAASGYYADKKAEGKIPTKPGAPTGTSNYEEFGTRMEYTKNPSGYAPVIQRSATSFRTVNEDYLPEFMMP